MGAQPPCFAAQGFAAQGLAAQGLDAQGLAAQGWAAQGLAAHPGAFFAGLAFFALALHDFDEQGDCVPDAAAGADAMASPPATVSRTAMLAILFMYISSLLVVQSGSGVQPAWRAISGQFRSALVMKPGMSFDHVAITSAL